MAPIVIHGVQPHEAREWWGLVDEWLQKALDEDFLGSHGLDDIHQAVESQHMQLWAVFAPNLKAALVTQIANYPKASSLVVILCGGSDLQDWALGATDVLQRFAKHHGCSSVACNGRKGWVRALKNHGWREIATTVAIEA